MMRHDRRRSIALVGGPETLDGLEGRLLRANVVLRRVPVLEFPEVVPRPRCPWPRRPRTFDLLLVGSLRAVDRFVRPCLDPASAGRATVWAVGATTARAMRRLGWRRVRSAPRAGIDAVLAALGPGRGRRLVYPRSDRAGPDAGRRLRARGWRVWDPIVYRTRTRPALRPSERRLLERADAWIATSPSSLSALRRLLEADRFERLRQTVLLIALGDRTLRAARGHGFRNAESAGTATVQGLTYYVVRRFPNGTPPRARAISIASAARPRRAA